MKALHDVHLHNDPSGCCGDNQATAETMIRLGQKYGPKLMDFVRV